MVSKKKYSLYGATEFHEKRSNRSRGADNSKTAKTTRKRPTKEWYKNPSKSDVFGIDSKKVRATNVKQPIGFLQSISKTRVPDKNIEIISKKRAIITHQRTTVRTLQKAINIRFANVQIYKRRKQGRPKDFWISVLK